MTADRARARSGHGEPVGLFLSYRPFSFFRPHWLDYLAEQGWDHLAIDPRYRDENRRSVERMAREREWERLLMTIGDIPFDLDTFRWLPFPRKVAFCADDEWRFYSTGRYLGRYFDRVVTTVPERVADYHRHGGQQALLAPWGANMRLFRPLRIPKRFDAVVIGAPHPDRVETVRRLARSGIDISVFGAGWDRYPDLRTVWHGYLPAEEVARVINEARIVVNTSLSTAGPPAVKARPFETAACGSFQLCGASPGLAHHYQIGHELITYEGHDDLVEKIQYYLGHEEEREAIARRALGATVERHTVEQQLRTVLSGFEVPSSRPSNPETPVLVIGLAGSRPEDDVATVGGRFLEYDGGDVRPTLESSLRESSDVFLAFAEPGVSYDQDRLWLMAFGLQHDRQRGRFMNLAPFDVTDGRGRVYACSFIDTIATADFSLVPWSSVMVSGRALVERDGSHGPLTLERLRASMLPDMVIDGQTESIDLGTGLFTTRGRGRFGFMNIYRQSVSGLWDVRTRAYGRRVWRSGSCLAALNLASALVARQRERARQRAVPQ